jgi:hypothetical protein
MTGFQSKRIAVNPWINNDIHRTKLKIIEPKPKSNLIVVIKKQRPYPTRERLHQLFILDRNQLVRKKPHHKERLDRTAGYMARGKWYVLVDGKQCMVDRLIKIFKGEE